MTKRKKSTGPVLATITCSERRERANCVRGAVKGKQRQKSYSSNGEAGKAVDVLESDTLGAVILPSSQGYTDEPGAQPAEVFIRRDFVVDPICKEHSVEVNHEQQRTELHLQNLLCIFVCPMRELWPRRRELKCIG